MNSNITLSHLYKFVSLTLTAHCWHWIHGQVPVPQRIRDTRPMWQGPAQVIHLTALQFPVLQFPFLQCPFLQCPVLRCPVLQCPVLQSSSVPSSSPPVSRPPVSCPPVSTPPVSQAPSFNGHSDVQGQVPGKFVHPPHLLLECLLSRSDRGCCHSCKPAASQRCPLSNRSWCHHPEQYSRMSHIPVIMS